MEARPWNVGGRSVVRPPHARGTKLELLQPFEALREAPGVAPLGLGQGLEPLGDLGEVLLTCGLGTLTL